MNKYALAAAAALTTVGLTPSAQAAQFLTITGPSGTFGDDTVACAAGATAPCSFSRTFTFATPAGFNSASATISSIIAAGNSLTNIDFTSVTLNGTNFAVAATGAVEFRNLLSQALMVGGNNVLQVNGTTGGEGSFSGTLSFASAAVPEPATWAMMMLGFGGLGYSMRNRAKLGSRIRYA